MLSVSCSGQLRERSLVAEENDRGEGDIGGREDKALEKAVNGWHRQREAILRLVNLFYLALRNAPQR